MTDTAKANKGNFLSDSKVLRRFMKNRLAVVGAFLVLIFIVAAIFAPYLAPKDPLDQNLRDRRKPPSANYLLGADQFGRDILSRIIFGSRYALMISSLSVFVSLTIGTFLGMFAGYLGGVLDEIIMRSMDVIMAFPYMLLAILIVTALGAGITNSIVAIGIWCIPIFARQARGAVVDFRDSDFVSAARSIGASGSRVIFRHLFPNIIPPIIVYASINMGYAILMESALTFLGLGVQPPTPSWATMIAAGRDYITSSPHIATVPGVAIMLITLGFNLIGDGLRDDLDPKREMLG